MNVKVSIIIPIYNVENYLDRCMQSLLNQTLKDIEIIMVDDGSPDNCPKMCDEYAKKDNRVKVVHKENGGLSDARNAGLAVATGEYVAFVDSDDFTSLDAYYTLYEKAKNGNFDIVYAGFTAHKANGETFNGFCLDKTYLEKDIINFLGDMIYQSDFSNESEHVCMSVWNGIYRRSLIESENIRFLSERKIISEDIIFHCELLPLCKSVCCIPVCFYNYCYNETSLTHNFNCNKIVANESLYDKMCEILHRYNIYELDNKVAHFFFTYTRGVLLKNIILSNMSFVKKRACCFQIYNSNIWKKAMESLRTEHFMKSENIVLFIIRNKLFVMNYLMFVIVYKLFKYSKY